MLVLVSFRLSLVGNKMRVFGYGKKSRGCFKVFQATVGQGARLEFLGGHNFPRKSGDNVVVTGVEFAQKEKFGLVQCFNNNVFTYAFGHDPINSMITVTATAFLINSSGTANSDAMRLPLYGYNRGRLSASLKASQVSIGGSVLTGFIVGMSSATQDPEFNLQTVTVNLLAVSVADG